MRIKFHHILLLVLTCVFIFFSQLINPHFVHALDRLYLLAPCCHGDGGGGGERKSNSDIGGVAGFRSRGVSELSAVDSLMWYLARFMMRFVEPPDSDSRATTSTPNFNSDSDRLCCDLCRRYQKLRCHVRVGRLTLPRFNWWNKAKLSNVKVRSSDKCRTQKNRLVGNGIVSMWDIFPLYLLQGHFGMSMGSNGGGGDGDVSNSNVEHDFVRHTEIVNVGEYEYKYRSSSSSSSTYIYPPAFEISELSIDIGSVHRPIVDINATNITINFIFSSDKLMIGSSNLNLGLGVSVPSIKLGGWTMNDLLSMIPDPPEAKGLYPRLGIVNVTNVTLVIHDERADQDDRKRMINQKTEITKVFDLPNELFLPLLLLTQKASGMNSDGDDGDGGDGVSGMGGIDRTDIQDVLQESAMMAFRKYVLGEDTILKTMQKPVEFIDALRTMMESLFRGGGGGDEKDDHNNIFEHHWLCKKIRQFLAEVEQNWNEAIHNKNGHFYKITHELWDGWHQIRDSISDSVADMEANIGGFFEHMEEEAEQVRRDMEHFVESGLQAAKQMELGAGQAWRDMEKLIEGGLKDAKGLLHQILADRLDQIYDEEF